MENKYQRKHNLTKIPQLVNIFDDSAAGIIPQEIRITTTYLKKWWALERFPYKLIMKSLGLQTVSFRCVGNTLKHTQIILGKLVLMEGRRVREQSSL